MNWPEFEEHLKQLTDAHETPTDTEALWRNIQQKRRRRLLLFWLTGSGAVLSICSLFLWYQQKHVKGMGVNPSIAQQAIVAPKIPTRQDLAPIRQEQTTSDTATNSRAAIRSTPTKQKPPSPTTRSIKTSPKKTVIAYTGSAVRPIPDPGAVAARTGQFPTQAVRALPAAAGNPLDSNSAVTAKPSETPLESGMAELLQHPVLATVAQERASTVRGMSFLTALQPLLLAAEPPHPRLPVLTQSLPAENKSKTLPSAHYRPAIGLSGGYYGWQPVLGKQPDSSLYLPVQTRSLETVQGSGLLRLPLSKKWALQTGLSYTRTTQVLHWERQWEDQRSRTVYSYYSNGAVDSTNTLVTVLLHRQIQHYNHWTQIGIPLTFQYQAVFKKWCFAPQAGVLANWAFPAKGIVISQPNQPDADLFEARYRRRLQLQAQLGIEISYALGPNWQLSAGPRMQFDFTPRTAKNEVGTERFLQYGITVGLWRRVGRIQ